MDTSEPLFTDRDWQACYESFLRELRNKSGSAATVASYRGFLKRFFKGRNPETVTRTDISAFVYALTDSNQSKGAQPQAATINSRCACLRSFYAHASTFTTSSGATLYDKANPTTGIRFGRPNVSYKSMSESEIRAFFGCIDRNSLIGRRDYSLYMFFLVSARRRSSVQRMTFGDLERGMITDEKGANHMGWCYHFREKGNSTVADSEEIETAVVELIMDYLEADGRLATATPSMPIWRAHGPCSGGNVGNEIRPLSSKAMQDAMKKYLVLAGLDPKRFSLHSFRHSSAKMRRLAGSSVLDISRTLRHSSLDMSMRYIGKLVSQADDGGRLLSAQLERLGVLQSKEHGKEGGRPSKLDAIQAKKVGSAKPLGAPVPQGVSEEAKPATKKETKKRAPRTRDKVAAEVGLGSGKTYENVKKVVDTIDTLKEKGHTEEAQALQQVQ